MIDTTSSRESAQFRTIFGARQTTKVETPVLAKASTSRPLAMAGNHPAKARAPELSSTPEEFVDAENDGKAQGGGLPHNRSAFNLLLGEIVELWNP